MQGQTIDATNTELSHHDATVSHHEAHPDHRLFGLFMF
jgi:cytochrome c oxidase subunit III